MLVSGPPRSQLNNRNNAFPFYDKATADKDCNVAMTSMALELVTGVQLSAADTRAQGGKPGAHPTGNTFTRRVFMSEGLIEGTDYLIFGQTPTQTFRDLLHTGWFVVCYLQYDVLARLEPMLANDTYDDAHATGMADWWRSGGRRQTHWYDPLADGRVSSHLGRRASKGPQTMPFPSIREAMWAYSIKYEGAIGPGFVSGYAVKPKL